MKALQLNLNDTGKQFLGFLSTCYEKILDFSMEIFKLIEPVRTDDHVFQFSDFLASFAILLVLLTLTNVRYRFRAYLARFSSTKRIFYWYLILFFTMLFTEFYFSNYSSIPKIFSNQIYLELIFGALFFIPILYWIYSAFITPPIFNKHNAQKYFDFLYNHILQGSDQNLPIIANELFLSAANIIEAEKKPLSKEDIINPKQKDKFKFIAHSILLLIANRKFCKHIVTSTPITAIVFFEAITKFKKYNAPINRFGINIFEEAILYDDSIIYHEQTGYKSGLLGSIKNFKMALFSDFDLIENLTKQNSTIFDIDYRLYHKWNHQQFKAFCECFYIFFESYVNEIQTINHMYHSFGFVRGLDVIKSSCSNLRKINNLETSSQSEEENRVSVAIDLFRDFISYFSKTNALPNAPLRKNHLQSRDIYGPLAELMYEITFSASYVSNPPDTCWWVQHNLVFCAWEFLPNSKALEIISHRYRRMIYDEIKTMDEFPNYKSIRILGFCLNVMGIVLQNKSNSNKLYYALHKAVISWTKKNFLRIYDYNPDIANCCLMGSMQFDEKREAIVRVSNKHLDGSISEAILELDNSKNETV